MDRAAILRATAGADNVRINDRGSTAGVTIADKNTDIWTAIKELQAAAAEHERLARGRRKLTWNREEKQPVSVEHAIGLWNPNLPGYTFSGNKTYHIQNRMILDAAGNRISLEEIDNEPKTWTDRRGFHEADSDRQTIAKKFLAHLRECAAVDSMLCNICFEFTARDAQDSMKHMYKAHPVEFAALVQDETAEVPAAPEPEPLTCCGKTFKNQQGLLVHRKVAKAHTGVAFEVA